MLNPLGGDPKTRRFQVYDLEWVPGTLEVRLVGVYDGERYHYHTSVEAFLACDLNRQNRGSWFYAHAGGLYDVQFIFEKLMDSRLSMEAVFSASSAIMVKVYDGEARKNCWHFMDSYWLLRDSLASIAKSLGREKTGPQDASEEKRKEWYAEAPLSELIPYNRNDCEILWEAINNLQIELLELGGQLQPTIASCAMYLFRKAYLERPIRNEIAINEIGRKAYTASRVEVFSKTCDEGFYYDVNSSFPWSMTQALPGNMIRELENFWPEDPERLTLVEATIETPDSYIPPLPYRYDNKVFFPVGRWRGWWTGLDLMTLLEAGGKIVRIHECYEFEARFDCANYVNDIYARRARTEDPFQKIVYKYLLNSLYGKFGESPEKTRVHVRPSAQVLAGLSRAKMLLPGVFADDVVVDVPHEHVPFAAYVTSRSRGPVLWRYLSDHPGNVYYCDTDGFATDAETDTSPALGKLKLEKKIVSGEFISPKIYHLNATVLDKSGQWKPEQIYKAKGFSLNRGNSGERFRDLANGLDIAVDRMRRLRENLNKGQIKPVELITRKGLRDGTPKRFYYPDGTSRPWQLEEIIG